MEEFERLIFEGRSSFRSFTRDELREDGVPERVLADANYIPISGYLSQTEEFDADFFGFSGVEARLMDPQYRLFLETAYEALDRSALSGRIRGLNCGVFASCGMSLYSGKNLNSYFRNNVEHHEAVLDDCDAVQVKVLSDKDYLATQLSYRLNLKGPSLVVQTACSSSLVAVNMAVQSLRAGACDAALAGAAALHAPRKAGYLHVEGGIYSADGRCAPFSDEATGTVGGNGVGVVVLRRLADALRDNDPIQAVIRGVATNNDGAQKVSFTAPSLEGQRSNIVAALRDADVSPRQIGYVEAHGTGTKIGDPIEVAALAQAFATEERSTQYCALGSVKANIGHLDTAAGIASLLKALLVVKRGEIPPQPNFRRANPLIDFATTPFFVSDESKHWATPPSGRTALVSSLGAGGTNAHLILSEWRREVDEHACSSERAEPEMLAMSAKNQPALLAYAAAYETLLATSKASLADICGSALTDREHFAHRLAVAGVSKAQIAARLREYLAGEQPETVQTGRAVRPPKKGVTFAFSGQGTQWAGMGRLLDARYPVFRRELDRFEPLFLAARGQSLRALMYEDGAALLRTENAQPAIFAYEWALASLWSSLGIKPAAVLGHSVGEFVAACLAGVMSELDAFGLVLKRGELIGKLRERGGMLAVMLGRTETEAAMAAAGVRLDVASENGPTSIVLSGTEQELENFSTWCRAHDITCKRLAVSHGFHSSLMDPVLAEMQRAAAAVPMTPPAMMLISNVTGDVAGSEVADPDYWVRHLRQEVRFHQSVKQLVSLGHTHILEIGPKTALTAHLEDADAAVVALGGGESGDELSSLAHACARLYIHGHSIDWVKVAHARTFRRTDLPTYPFQRRGFWLAARRSETPAAANAIPLTGTPRLLKPIWTPVPAPLPSAADGTRWIVIGDDNAAGWAPGGAAHVFTRAAHDDGPVDTPPQLRDEVREACLATAHRLVFAPAADTPLDTAARDFLAVLQFAASNAPLKGIHLVTRNAHQRSSGSPVNPVHAALWSMLRAARLELEGVTMTASDLAGAAPDELHQLGNHIAASTAEPELAFEGSSLFRPGLAVIPSAQETGSPGWEHGETVVITGGFGDIALDLCERLTERHAAKVVLVGRANALVRATDRLERLARAGRAAIPVVCDIADAESLASSLAAVLGATDRIGTVLHLAGTLADATLEHMTMAQLSAALWPKATGLTALLEATAPFKPRRLVLFSSIAASFGSLGQANYAAANGFLDGAARQAEGRAMQVVSIGWGPWAQVGMATRGAARSHLSPISGLSNDTAWGILERSLAVGYPHVLAVELTESLNGMIDQGASLPEVANGFWATPEEAPVRQSFRDLLAETPVAARLPLAEGWVSLAIAKVLGERDGYSVDPTRAFHELGLDSLKIIQLRNRLNKMLGISLVTSDFYNHPTAHRLGYLLTRRMVDEPLPSVRQGEPQFPPGRELPTADEMLRLIGEELSNA